MRVSVVKEEKDEVEGGGGGCETSIEISREENGQVTFDYRSARAVASRARGGRMRWRKRIGDYVIKTRRRFTRWERYTRARAMSYRLIIAREREHTRVLLPPLRYLPGTLSRPGEEIRGPFKCRKRNPTEYLRWPERANPPLARPVARDSCLANPIYCYPTNYPPR